MVYKFLYLDNKNFAGRFDKILPYPGTKSPFLGPKNFTKFLKLHLVPGAPIQKKIKNTGSTWY
jgi:hypothetical protein